MPPLVMPWAARKLSSVCTNTSKIALPIPRTSYFAVVIHQILHQVLLRQLRGRGKSAPSRVERVQRPITIDPAPASDALIEAFMIRSFLTVSTGTLASRLLGFARDALIAALLGAGPIADAFLMAFQLVNVIRRLLTEGALNAALVPAWLRVRETGGAVAAAAFAGTVLGTVSAALIVAAALIGLLMPLVIAALAPGFVGYKTLQLAVNDARLMLPYLAFAGPATVMMALMSAQHRFALTAFSPLLFNIALISVMIALLGWRQDPADAATIIAATVGIAGLLQLVILLLRRGGGSVATPLRVSFDAGMRG